MCFLRYLRPLHKKFNLAPLCPPVVTIVIVQLHLQLRRTTLPLKGTDWRHRLAEKTLKERKLLITPNIIIFIILYLSASFKPFASFWSEGSKAQFLFWPWDNFLAENFGREGSFYCKIATSIFLCNWFTYFLQSIFLVILDIKVKIYWWSGSIVPNQGKGENMSGFLE